MTISMPAGHVIEHAVNVARMSPCRSKRGVVLWNPNTGSFVGHGFNAPPALRGCPGRERCAGRCGQVAVHAEARAIYAAALARIPNLETGVASYELLHVELGARAWTHRPDVLDVLDARDGLSQVTTPRGFELHGKAAIDASVVACDGPSCMPCASLILDVGFVGGVWLFERIDGDRWDRWRRYTAEEFYDATWERDRG